MFVCEDNDCGWCYKKDSKYSSCVGVFNCELINTIGLCEVCHEELKLIKCPYCELELCEECYKKHEHE